MVTARHVSLYDGIGMGRAPFIIMVAMHRFPPRLHVLLARHASVGVILRRGPSKSVCAILWDRQRDTFELGQWLRGRIYERRSDLSPDGKHLIYFAMNGRWRSPTKGSWTAISRAPWLKALVLLGKGDCWNGGGLFIDKKKYWLNDGYGHQVLKQSTEVQRDPDYRPSIGRGGGYGGECPGVYYVRLQRDGWELKEALSDRSFTVFEKPLPHGFRLRKYAHAEIGAPPGKGCYWDEHELDHPDPSKRVDGKGWEWAELDGRQLVFAQGGGLFRANLQKSGLAEPKLLRDFSDMKFEAIAAPYR